MESPFKWSTLCLFHVFHIADPSFMACKVFDLKLKRLIEKKTKSKVGWHKNL